MNKKEKITHHFAKYVKSTCVQNTTCNQNCPRICGLLNIVKGTFHGKLKHSTTNFHRLLWWKINK